LGRFAAHVKKQLKPEGTVAFSPGEDPGRTPSRPVAPICHLIRRKTTTGPLGSSKCANESEFLWPYDLRAITVYHGEHPNVLEVEGMLAIDYKPTESTSGMLGGNSNCRGPIWFPLNYPVVSVLERYRRFLGAEFIFEVSHLIRQAADAG
jgi:hypothetical protein